MNMNKWLQDMMNSSKKTAMPILSFPSVQIRGISVKELLFNSDNQAKGMADIAERYDTAAAVSMMDLSVEAECFGAEIQVYDDEVPTVSNAIVFSEADAEALQVPAVGSARSKICIEAMKKALTLIKDRPVFAGVIGPFSLAGRLIGMTDIMINCYEEPEMVEKTLEKATEFISAYIAEFKKAGLHGVVMAEPAAGLLSPTLCEEFSSQYIKKITDRLQDEEFIIIYHNCGPNIGILTQQILDTGCAAYHFGNSVSMEEMLNKMPKNILVMGNLDPVSVLRYGTIETVREKTFELLKNCGTKDNFLPSSGCDIPPECPLENIDMFFKAVKEFYES